MADQDKKDPKNTRNSANSHRRTAGRDPKGKENIAPDETKEKMPQSDKKQAEKEGLDKILDPVKETLLTKPNSQTPKIPKKPTATAAAGSAQQNVQNPEGQGMFNAIPQYLQQWTPNNSQFRPQNQMQMYASPPQFAPQQFQAPMMQPMSMAPQYMQPMQPPVQPVVQYVPHPNIQYYEDEDEVYDEQDSEQDVVEPFGDYSHEDLQEEVQDIDIHQFVKQFIKSKGTEKLTPQKADTESARQATEFLQEYQDEELNATAEDPDQDPSLKNKFDAKWVGGFVIVEDEEVGPPVMEEAQSAVDQFWDLAMKNSKGMQIAKDYKLLYRPSNCKNITFTQMNPLMKELVPEGKDKRDRLPFAIHTGILKGTNGIVLALGTLMEPEVDFEGKEEVLTWIMQSLRSLAYANGQLMELRRQQIKPYLPWHYHKIIDDVPTPSHQWLFGEKFEEAITERDRIMSLVRRIKAKQFGGSSSGGRGGGSSRGRYMRGNRPFRYQPYRLRGSGGFRNGRSNIQYDQYGTPYSEYSNFDFSYNQSLVHNVVNMTQSVALTCSFQSPAQIGQSMQSVFVHPGEIGFNPNTSYVCSSTQPQQRDVQTETLPEERERRKEVQLSQKKWTEKSSQHNLVGDTSYIAEITIREEFLVGGLAKKYKKWTMLTSDPEILGYVQGVKLDFIEEPVQDRLPHEIKFSAQEEKMVRKEINKFLELGILKKSSLQTGDYVSNLFARPKKEPGRVRLIANLKSLNNWVKFVHFKMEGVEDVINLMRPGMYMVSIDFTSSFYSISVDPRFRKYLKVIALGEILEFQALPMGYGRSPLIFCKLLKVPLAYLRQQYGYTNCAFVDDIWMGEDTIPEIQENAKDSMVLLDSLGYTINIPKSDVGPDQVKPHLGLIFDTIHMTVSLTEEKIEKIIDHAQKILKENEHTIRTVASLIGQFNAARYAVYYGPLHTKSLEIAKNAALVQSKGDFDGTMHLSRLDKMDVRWWIEILPTAKKFVGYLPFDEVVHTDASTQGYGFWHSRTKVKTGGRWSPKEKEKHINVLEISAIDICLRSLFDDRHDLHVQVFCDSQVAIACINRMGSTKSLPCNTATRNLLLYCEQHNFVLTMSWIPSLENKQADEASRVFNNPDTEWMLDRNLFHSLCAFFQFQPQIDLFADRLNHQLPVYCAWMPDPHAKFIDAMSIDWSLLDNPYAFSPFSLLSRLLKKLSDTPKTLHMMIVAPMWPTQAWYSRLVNSLIQTPVIISVKPQTLVLVHSPKKVHPLAGKLKLIAGIISSNPLDAKVFQNQFPPLCVMQEPKILTSNMQGSYSNGKTIVAGKRLIPVTNM